jgi:predicted DNA-binding transcriptional regulator YafY
MMTAEVLKRMEKRLSRREQQTIGDLLYAQGGPLYTPKPSIPSLPEPIEHALKNQLDLEIEYAGLQSKISRRIISPRYATENRGITYLIAYCHAVKDMRTFRLDRMLRVQIVEGS